MNTDPYLILKETKFFASLPEQPLRILAEAAHLRHFKQGELIIQENALTQGCYIILSGTGSVFSVNNQAGIKKIIAKVGVSSLIGELSTIQKDYATFSVEADEDIECLLLDGDVFRALLATQPEISQTLLPMVIERLYQLINIFIR